jgi:hypothetical protein
VRVALRERRLGDRRHPFVDELLERIERLVEVGLRTLALRGAAGGFAISECRAGEISEGAHAIEESRASAALNPSAEAQAEKIRAERDAAIVSANAGETRSARLETSL